MRQFLIFMEFFPRRGVLPSGITHPGNSTHSSQGWGATGGSKATELGILGVAFHVFLSSTNSKQPRIARIHQNPGTIRDKNPSKASQGFISTPGLARSGCEFHESKKTLAARIPPSSPTTKTPPGFAEVELSRI